MPRKISRKDLASIIAEREGVLELLDNAETVAESRGGVRIPIRGPADVAAVRRSVDDVLRVVVGTTVAEAGAAIAICDALAPLLLRSPDPRALAIGAALKGACRIRRAIRRRT